MIEKDKKPRSKNVLGNDLEECGFDPMTGFYRTGYCLTGPEDRGTHTVCAIITAEFLNYTKSKGNDLSTPMPQFGFPGLNVGEHWCLCATRWLEAYEAGVAPPVNLSATHIKTLDFIPIEMLK